MKEDVTAGSFASEVKKLVTRHVLFPVLFAYMLLSVVIVFFYGYSVSYSTKKACSQASQRFESVVASYEGELNRIVSDKALQAILLEDENPNSFSSAVYSFVNSQSIGATFFLLDADGKMALGSSTILSSYLDDPSSVNNGFIYRLRTMPDRTIESLNTIGNARANSVVFTIAKAITRGDTVIGFFVFELIPQEIIEYISTGEIGDIVVTNSYYTSLLTSKNEYIDPYSRLKSEFRVSSGIHMVNSQRFYVYSNFIDEIDCRVIVISKVGAFAKVLTVTLGMSLVLMVAFLVIVTKRSGRIVTDEASSIDDLLARIDRMKEVGLYAPIDPMESNFSTLERSYNQLIENIRDLAESNRQEVQLRELAERRQLESQFNPHFIFNTLEIIRCYIKTDPKMANRMILDFSGLLRYSIDSSHEVCSLKDDLKYVESYLSMNKLCRPSSLDYHIELSEGLDCVNVPKLCIQPIVENAIKYAPKGKTLILSVEALKLEGQVCITITDNGSGISESMLSEIRSVMESPNPPKKHFGIYSVNRRLNLCYGQSANMNIRSDGAGTTVEIVVPLE